MAADLDEVAVGRPSPRRGAIPFVLPPIPKTPDAAGMSDVPQHQIRAVYDEHRIRVYQAYSDEIADAALSRGTFAAPPFSMKRMTWIKPSFLWMMYRSGWGYKEAGQRRILAIDISRAGFDWALAHSCPSQRDPSMTQQDWSGLKAGSPVRIQWDPERDLHLKPLPYRAIQIGIGGEAVALYVQGWILGVTDATNLARTIFELINSGDTDRAASLLPPEQPYHS